MSKVIPKEKLTAYQRWELAAFDEAHPEGGAVEGATPEVLPDAGVEVDEQTAALRMAFPTAEDLERIHQEAWQEGFDLGKAEGHKAGFEVGRADGEGYARQLKALAEALETERTRQDEALAQEVLALAIGIARQVVGTSLRLKPELILDTVREALLSLPSLSGHYRVVVHPDSARVVRDWLDQEHGHLSWKIIEDEHMESGGFRFESAHSELDASMETRWREVTDCLGAKPEWLD